MYVVDDVNLLNSELDTLENFAQDASQQLKEEKIVSTARNAKSLVEVIDNIDFKQYGHTLKKNIRIVRVVNGRSEDSEVIYKEKKSIALRRFCNAMVHMYEFTFNRRMDGKHWLEVTNRYGERYQVFYSDFISGLRSCVLSRRLVVLAFCELTKPEFAEVRKECLGESDSSRFSSMSLGWIIRQHLNKEDQLKLDILKEKFGIEFAPAEVLPNLRFSIKTEEPDGQMTTEFDPPWEDGQRTVSLPFHQADLFNLIRDFYKDPNSLRRRFN